MDELLKTFVYILNHEKNGGEHVLLTTKFYNHDNKIDFDQEFSLQSFGNSAHICLNSCQLTPAVLRKLADELEIAEKECEQIIQKRIGSEKVS